MALADLLGLPDFSGVAPIAQTDPAARERTLSGIASSTPVPNVNSRGLRAFLGLDGDGFSGLRDAAGRAGDFLLQANNMKPIYADRLARHQKRQLGGALEQFLGGPDSILGNIAQIDPAAALTLWKEQPKVQRSRAELIGDVDNRLMQILGGTRNQEQYDAALARARNIYGGRFGLNLDDLNLPTEWSPETAEMFRNQGATPAQQIAGVTRDRRLDWDIEDDVFDNTRADRSTDDVIADRAARRAETKRYHNLTDASRRRGQDLTNARASQPRPERRSSGSSGTADTASLPLARTPEEARRLPSGTRFRTPDGKIKVVP